jgi:hypothetical protein
MSASKASHGHHGKRSSHRLQEQQEESQRQGNTRLTPERIHVVIVGWPNELAHRVAQASLKHGFQVCTFGLSLDDAKSDSIEVENVGKIELTKMSASDVKAKLESNTSDCKDEKGEQYVHIIADTSGTDKNIKMYNELKIPYVIETEGEDRLQRAVRDTEAARTFAVISDDFNKHIAVLDALWQDWSKRFPSLFYDFDLDFRASDPSRPSKRLMNSFSDVLNKEFKQDQVRQLSQEDQKKLGYTEGSACWDYTFKNGTGNSMFSFRVNSNNKEATAEGIADAVGFIAQKSQELARPQVFNIVDVAEQGRLTWW